MSAEMIASSRVASVLSNAIKRSGRTVRDIAKEVGLRSNFLSMLQRGNSKVPLSRAPALAVAVGLDAPQFLRLCMSEYTPDLLEVVDTYLGSGTAENKK